MSDAAGSERFRNPTPDEMRSLLERCRTIAVVGLSPKPGRPSHFVSAEMQRFGYRIVPVRPATAEVLGERAYPSLREVPFAVDMVNLFRAPQHVGPIVDDCIALGIRALWLQEGVVNEAEALRAQAVGIAVVMDRCIYKDYLALVR